SRRRHTRCYRDWSSDVCSSDLGDFQTGGVTVTCSFFSYGCGTETPESDCTLKPPFPADKCRPALHPLPPSAAHCPRHRPPPGSRSEERRVGKESSCGGRRRARD